VGLESHDVGLLRDLEAALKNPRWTLCLGRKAFPISVPPWLRGGGIRENLALPEALRSAPWLLLHDGETLPQEVTFVVEPGPSDSAPPVGAVPMRLADRPLDFGARRFGVRQTQVYRLPTADCGMEVDRCTYRR
jgi:CRISPR system Cascade subunit CasD